MKRTILTGFLFLIMIVLFHSIAGDFKYKIDENRATIMPKFLNPNVEKMEWAPLGLAQQDYSFILFLNDLYRKVLSPEQLAELNKTRYTLLFYLYPKTGQIFFCWFNCKKENRTLINECQLREISDAVLKARYKPSYLKVSEKEDRKSKIPVYSMMSVPVKIIPLPE